MHHQNVFKFAVGQPLNSPSQSWDANASNRHRSALLLNANAKKVTARRCRVLRRKAGDTVDVYVSSSLKEAEAALNHILKNQYGSLILGGGDGTVMAAIEQLFGLAESNPDLVVPTIRILGLGTGNAIAHHIRTNTRATAGALGLEGATMQIPTTLANGRLSTFGGFGWDALVLQDYNALKDSIGEMPLLSPFVKTLAGYMGIAFTKTFPTMAIQKPKHRIRVLNGGERAFQLSPDGEKLNEFKPGSTIFDGEVQVACFGNISYFGYQMKLLPFAVNEHGLTHLRLMDIGPFDATLNIHKIWQGRLRHPGLTDLLVSEAYIEVQEPAPLQLNGDYIGQIDCLTLEPSLPVNCGAYQF